MRLIDADALKKYMRNALEEVRNCYPDGGKWAEVVTEEFCKDIDEQPTVETEPYKEKLNEIASALSEKFAYMNTCPNERDIILGYLGVKRPCKAHCNTDCTITKCESHPSFEQSEQRWIPVSETEPKKSGHYLCTHVLSNSVGGIKIVCPDYYTTQKEAEELFSDPEDEYLDLEEYIGWTSKNVIAWMPMPKPYQGEGE